MFTRKTVFKTLGLLIVVALLFVALPTGAVMAQDGTGDWLARVNASQLKITPENGAVDTIGWLLVNKFGLEADEPALTEIVSLFWFKNYHYVDKFQFASLDAVTAALAAAQAEHAKLMATLAGDYVNGYPSRVAAFESFMAAALGLADTSDMDPKPGLGYEIEELAPFLTAGVITPDGKVAEAYVGLANSISGETSLLGYITTFGQASLEGLKVHNITQGTYYATIQEAINAASSGDTLYIAEGTYKENAVLSEALNPNKQLNFIGAVDGEGKPLPVIEGSLTIDLPFDDDNWSIENLNFVVDDEHTLILRNVNGLTIKNCTFDGAGKFSKNGINITTGPNHNNFKIEDSHFLNGLYVAINGYVNELSIDRCLIEGVKSGVNIQGAVGNKVLVNETHISVIAQAADSNTYGFRFASGESHNAGTLVFKNGSISVDKNGLIAEGSTLHSAIIIRSGADGPLTFEDNVILGDVVNQSSVTLNATPNYWGSPCGPSNITGNVVYAPWYADEAMTEPPVNAGDPFEYTFPSGTSHEEINAVVACAAPGSTLIFDGEYEASIWVHEDREDLTFLLKDGTVIVGAEDVDNTGLGYAFYVDGDDIRIEAESIGSAKLVPIYGRHAVNVASYPYVSSGVSGFVLEGVEIDGAYLEDQKSGSGIYFGSSRVENVQIVNNYVHDLNDGSHVKPAAMTLEADIEGEFDVQGNFFQNVGPVSLLYVYEIHDFRYNSWGSFVVDEEQVYYKEIGFGTIDFDPWTHAEIKLKSTYPTEDKLENHVFVDETITYEVYGVFHEVFGAEFTLTYDPNVLTVVDLDFSMSPFIAAGLDDLVVDDNAGNLRFGGMNKTYAPFTSANADGTPLYKVTFKPVAGTAKTTTKIGIKPKTDEFSFIVPFPEDPGDYREYYTNHIYGILPEDVDITVIDHPIITSDNITDYFLVGVEQQFEVSLANPDTGAAYEHVMFRITVPDAVAADITSIEYEETPGSGNWLNLPYKYVDGVGLVGWYGGVTYGGFPLTLPKAAEAGLLRVKFANDGAYTINLELFTVTGDFVSSLDYSAVTIRLIAKETYIMNVYDKPTIESDDIQGYYLTGEEQEFTVTTKNPQTGGNFPSTMFKITIPGAVLEDVINTIEYQETYDVAEPGTPEWKPLVLQQVGDDVVGWYGLVRLGGFPLKPNTNNDGLFRVDFKLAGTYTIQLELHEMNGSIPAPVEGFYDYSSYTVRKLTQEGFEMVVYTKPVITSDDIKGPYQAEHPQDFELEIEIDNAMCANEDIKFALHFNFPAGTVVTYNNVPYTCDGNVCTIPVNPCDLKPFTVEFAEGFVGDITVTLYDTKWEPDDRELASKTFEGVIAYGNFTVQGTISMQGRTHRGGVKVTLTREVDGYGPYNAESLNYLGINLTFNNVAGGTYWLTTNQPRYLNVIGELISIDVDGNLRLNALELKGGNASWALVEIEEGVWVDIINLADANLVGREYGSTGDPKDLDADVNFDGKVNIYDLALVGGNYGLTSGDAYGSWTP